MILRHTCIKELLYFPEECCCVMSARRLILCSYAQSYLQMKGNAETIVNQLKVKEEAMGTKRTQTNLSLKN